LLTNVGTWGRLSLHTSKSLVFFNFAEGIMKFGSIATEVYVHQGERV